MTETDPNTASSETTQRALPRGRQLAIVGVIAGLAALGAALLWGLRHWGTTDQASAPAPPAGTFEVTAKQLAGLTVEPVRLVNFRTEVETDGKIALNGDRTTPVFSPYGGRVVKVLAGPGDRVRAGDPLLAIAATEFVQAQNDLRDAIAQLDLATTHERRTKALYEAQGASLQDWQQAQADLATATTALAATREKLRILGRSDAEIDALGRARAIESVAYVTAPIDGVVTDRQVGPGQVLTANANPVFTIGDLASLWVVANAREADAALLGRGHEVEVRVLAYPNRRFAARIAYVAPAVDPVTHRIAVRGVIDNHEGLLHPEMFATVRIAAGEASKAPAVPESAVLYEGSNAHVWTVPRDRLLALRPIQTGRRSDGLVEVTAGLTAGERVVTRGGLFIDRAATSD